MFSTRRILRLILVIGLIAWLCNSVQVQAASPTQDAGSNPSPAALVRQLQQAGDGPVRISYHNDTGKVRFIGAAPEQAIRQSARLAPGTSPEAAARSFLNVYGSLFGLADPASELALVHQSTTTDGRSFVRFQQRYQGIPVIGGEMVVQMNGSQEVISAQGEMLPDIALNITPTINRETARQTALAKIAKDYNLSPADLKASEPELWIYHPAILGGPGVHLNTLVWWTEVTPLELLPIRELVLVDAQIGAVALNFNQVDTARNRLTYDANNGTTLPGTLRCNEANATCSGGDAHEVAAHTYAGDTYDFFLENHGRDSIDNAGMTLVSTVHYNSGYANAFWNGQQMVYGDAYGFPLGDDVVAHELSHGVTEHSSRLFYFYQSGAMNESFSDLWGEFVDLTNGAGNDTAGVRWQMGEDITGLGAIRSMQDPTLFGDPDRMGSSNYYCEQSDLASGDGDNGGVHINSGVNNKAVSLMTDGGTFNGYTVTGLGISKVADLYYEVQTNMLTSASDYADLYDSLIQACSSLGYSGAECQEVQDALNAVQMNQQPAGCPANEAPVCDAAGVSPTNLFFDNIEAGSSRWTAGAITGTPYWFVPQTASPIGLAEPYATSGVGNIWGYTPSITTNTYLAMNSSVTLPANAYLHFNHSFGFESNSTGSSRYDGGIVEYSTNSGATWTNAGALFTHNGYNGTLAAGNPLGAIQAFSADSRGYISSRLNLNSLAGQNARFRFRIGSDSTMDDIGWFIDDVRIYTCNAAVPPEVRFSSGTYSVNENGGSATITATLSSSYPQNVTVQYATSNGTATAGSDYTATSGTLTFTSGQTSQTFSVPISDDGLDEFNETISLALSAPVNATLGTPSTATLTINDNDTLPTVQFNSSTFSVNENGGSATITATLSAAYPETVSVGYATSNGTATSGSDYTATSGTLTFTSGQTSRTFSVSITDDGLDESNETVSLALSSPSNATLGSPSTATLTISDNDSLPTVQFSSSTFSVNENGVTATITATLSAAYPETVSVGYATSNGTATAGSDYTAASGTLTFTTGQTSRTFTVLITDDSLDEPDETVSLALSAPTNATLGALSTATLTIVDNDTLPTVQFNNSSYSVEEANGSVTITVTLSAGYSQNVTVDYATSNGTATSGSDYTAASGTLTFTPGVTSQTFTIAIVEDELPEEDETILLTLSNPSNATLGSPSTATVTILANEGNYSFYLPTVIR